MPKHFMYFTFYLAGLGMGTLGVIVLWLNPTAPGWVGAIAGVAMLGLGFLLSYITD